MMKLNMDVKVIETELCGYSLMVNGEVILECLCNQDIESLTLGEIAKLYEQFGEV